VTRFLAALGFLALNFYTYHFLATKPVIPPRASFFEFPLELGEWACAGRERMEPEVEVELGVTDYLICDFLRRPSDLVNVYVGYHATQIREEGGDSRENSIHPPAHCLPGSGWDIVDNRTVRLDLPGLPEPRATGKRLVIAKGAARQLVYYWYQSGGRVVSEDWKKIVYVGWDRALRGRTDGSLVRFTVPIGRSGDEARAEASLRDLAALVVPHLPRFVPE
jgi:EpsI family protein